MNSKKQPNILIIISDHLTRRYMGAYGLENSVTPHMDTIATGGVAINNVYTPCPLCRPARAAFWTGLYPHQTKVLSNGNNFHDPKVIDEVPTLGSVFKDSGYNTVHAGKTHDHGALRGFKLIPKKQIKVDGHPAWPVSGNTFTDRATTKQVIDFLGEKQEKPFVLVADLNNPHNICGYVGKNKGPHVDVPLPDGVELPHLPDNFEIDDMDTRPKPIQYLCCSHRRLSQAAGWNEDNYRHYIAAYQHYTKRVDDEVGLILEAFKKHQDIENTYIILFADHGDGIGSHRMVTKQVSFYDEITRVPFLIRGPGIPPGGKILDTPLASLLDLTPTLCDLANLPIPDGLSGQSLKPWLTGVEESEGREYIVSEWHTEWGYTISPGRMVRTRKYKYTRYIEGTGEELYDIESDPGERKNLANVPDYKSILENHRLLLKDHVENTGDPFFNLHIKVADIWRSHEMAILLVFEVCYEIGYQNHEGKCAPTAEGGGKVKKYVKGLFKKKRK